MATKKEDVVEKETVENETAEKETVEKETVKKETAKKEAVEKETVNKDTVDKKDVVSGPSKLPDFGEVINMGKTLFGSVQKGVKTIVEDYKNKRK